MNPDRIDGHAPVIACHSLVIDAALDVIWRLHTNVDNWPSWQHAIAKAHLEGPFAVGATFTWETYDLTITSTVYRMEPARHTLWGAVTAGIVGIHSWTFTENPDGVRVDTEESWSGAPVLAATASMQEGLDSSLTAWLGYLAAAAAQQR